jgi:ectoine hydroxylase-related dioxygenase (phytanoyl-CoA dioxygenase family)
VLSDASRPFFDWHVHIDGVDDAHYENKRAYPTFECSERVTHILYLDDLTEDNGQLLVYPRRLTDPTTPPFDPRREHWEGQVAIDCPRGSVVVLEQCTWHAAQQKRSGGIRAFVGSYFASGRSKVTPLADPALADWDGDDEVFRSILPRR